MVVYTASYSEGPPGKSRFTTLARSGLPYVALWPPSSPPDHRRKHLPVDTQQLAHQLEQAAQSSVYKLYTVISQSQELNSLTASKIQFTETLRNYLIGVANWALFLLRTRFTASAILAGDLGATPDPVEMEDPRDGDEPLAS